MFISEDDTHQVLNEGISEPEVDPAFKNAVKLLQDSFPGPIRWIQFHYRENLGSKIMIISRIQHGLGNQLFQYAVGKSLAHRNRSHLKLDTTWFESNSYRDYRLDHYQAKLHLAKRSEVYSFHNLKIIRKLRNHSVKFYNKLMGIKFFPYPAVQILYKEKCKGFDPNVLNLKGDVYLDGFWQSFKYFCDYDRLELFRDLRPMILNKDTFMKLADKIKLAPNSVAVHIRRGDYMLKKNNYNNRFGVLSEQYYSHAKTIISEEFSSISWFIFTNDIDWSSSIFKVSDNTTFISGRGLYDFEELELMSLCDHQIIANSTFSWWGAYLNENSEKKVFAPNPWMKDNSLRTSDLIPEEWIQLNSDL